MTNCMLSRFTCVGYTDESLCGCGSSGRHSNRRISARLAPEMPRVLDKRAHGRSRNFARYRPEKDATYSAAQAEMRRRRAKLTRPDYQNSRFALSVIAQRICSSHVRSYQITRSVSLSVSSRVRAVRSQPDGYRPIFITGQLRQRD